MQGSPEKTGYVYMPPPAESYPELHAPSSSSYNPPSSYYSVPHSEQNRPNQMPVYPYPAYNAQGEPINNWARESQRAYCQDCHAEVDTNVTPEPGVGTYAICTVIACAGCWYGCCLIPFCVNEFKDKVHRCPKCNKVIGVRKLIS